MLKRVEKKFYVLFIGLFFVFACNIGTTAPAEPAFDATKAVLELEATSMALQLTQTTMDNQAKPSPTVAPTLVPPTAPAEVAPTTAPSATEAPAMSEDFDTWMKSASILLFEDMAGSTDRRRYVNQALNGMGLKYVDVNDALGDYKNQILSGGPGGKGWDLIISAKENRNEVQGEFYEYLNTAINNGSAVIIEEWNMGGIGGGKLSKVTGKCGVKFDKDWIAKEIDDHLIFPINGTNPIHHIPNSGISLTNPTIYWGSYPGSRMKLTPGSEAIPLWGLYPNTQNSALTAVSCVDGRLIIQTYSTHSFGEDRVIRMWENYIYNTLKARYDYLASQ